LASFLYYLALAEVADPQESTGAASSVAVLHPAV